MTQEQWLKEFDEYCAKIVSSAQDIANMYDKMYDKMSDVEGEVDKELMVAAATLKLIGVQKEIERIFH